MKIGEAAARSGVPAKTIRYYESVGLIDPATRQGNGYRAYSGTDVHTLRFISRARGLGFTVKDVATLLALYRDSARASADVKAVAQGHVRHVDQKIRELQSMRAALLDLIERCHGDDRPDCPILADLAGAADRPGGE